jgi:tryptophan-rich sensory protein
MACKCTGGGAAAKGAGSDVALARREEVGGVPVAYWSVFSSARICWTSFASGAMEVSSATLPFLINLVANLLFTPLMFGLRSLPLATVDILSVWASLVWMAWAIWPYYRWVAVAQLPYFVWVSIATVLQLSIVLLNP